MGCASSKRTNEEKTTVPGQESTEVASTERITERTTERVTEADASEMTVTTEETEPEKIFDLSQVSSYAGEPYAEIDGNVPYFTKEERKSTDTFETYSALDRLGRCGVAYANLSPELMPEEERGEIGQIRPSGWKQEKYEGVVDSEPPYLYNRCHLIAYALAGENSNPLNLITGTRYLNMEGMLPFEIKVADYIEATGNHVLYRVTPVFEGENLVASGVRMEAWSVEDDGRGICFHVYCYNVQPGIDIDYLTGESKRTDEGLTENKDPEVIILPGDDPGNGENDVPDRTISEEDTTEQKENSSESTSEEPVKEEYILNTNTKKFHLPTCKSVNDMKEKNKRIYVGTYEEILNMGYKPCQNCLP